MEAGRVTDHEADEMRDALAELMAFEAPHSEAGAWFFGWHGGIVRVSVDGPAFVDDDLKALRSLTEIEAELFAKWLVDQRVAREA
jgi:hypothetical protein